MAEIAFLDVRTRAKWRAWFGKHHTSSRGLWVVFHKAPSYVRKAIKSDPDAWTFFQKLPRRECRNFVVWIHIAKRPETRERRIRESIALLAAGRKLGLK